MSIFDSFKKNKNDSERIEKAFAKINLALNVVGKKDGYHLLDSVMIPIKLHDTLEVSLLKTDKINNGIYLYCDDPEVDTDEKNIAWKALDLLKRKININEIYSIMIYKRIPRFSGLGGGSSDGAAVFRAFSNLVNDDLKNKIKNEIVPNIGCDVLFSLFNTPSRVRGFGEIVEPIKVKSNYQVLLVKPNKDLSTKEIFDLYDTYGNNDFTKSNIDELIVGLNTGNEDLISKNLKNELTEISISKVPEIKEILEIMKNNGLFLSSMTGSGSCCFALSNDERKLKKVKEIFVKKDYYTCISEFELSDEKHY